MEDSAPFARSCAPAPCDPRVHFTQYTAVNDKHVVTILASPASESEGDAVDGDPPGIPGAPDTREPVQRMEDWEYYF